MTDVTSFDELRREGIGHLERLAGGRWTDFNAHDPGITLLEQLCYAITDLGYRARFAVPDLLASGPTADEDTEVADGHDAYASLFAPDEILTTHPVTLTDLRQRILDVDGVKNAWIEPVTTPEVPLYHHAGRAELSMASDPLAAEPVELRGLYRVLVERSDLVDIDGTAVRAGVARAVHGNRNLCEDVTEIRILKSQDVRIEASIEIDRVDDVGALLLKIFERLDSHISPGIPFVTLEDKLAAGATFDQIFEGPRLAKGFVDDATLAEATRHTRLNTSDLVHLLMDLPGVRAVRQVRLATGGEREEWTLELDAGRVPRLDLAGSTIALVRNGIPVSIDAAGVIETFVERARQASLTSAPRGLGEPLVPAPGRDRQTARYRSVQLDLPALYGVGELGLPASASPERQAQARQLKAYLMIFDQLLANTFAQLAHVKNLFSFDVDNLATYAVGDPEDDGFGTDEIRAGGAAEHRARLEEITGDSLERRNRFLNHLLARFAEHLTDYSMVLPDAMPVGEEASVAEKLARDKQRLLARLPRISSARGTAFDYLRPVDGAEEKEENRSGLEQRLRLKLGLTEDEAPLVVEHILLRPMEGDDSQTVPLVTAVARADPYSLQVSVVFPDEPGRMRQAGFRQFVESTLRAETPAHLVLYVHWLERQDFDRLRTVYTTWVDKRRAYWTAKLGVTT